MVSQQPADGLGTTPGPSNAISRLKVFEGPGVVPVTKELVQLGCSAHTLYVMHLGKEQTEKEEAYKQLNLQKEGALQRKQEIKARHRKGRLGEQIKVVGGGWKGKKQFSKMA